MHKPFINSLDVISFKILQSWFSPARPNVRDLRLDTASLGFQPHSRKKIKKKGGALRGKKNHIALKTNLLGDPPAA